MTIMGMLLLNLFIVILCALVVFVSSDGCTFNLRIDVPPNEPVYLFRSKNGYRIFEPNDQISTIQNNIILFCPGRRNALSGSNASELACQQNHQFSVNPHSINCTKQVSGDLEVTNKPCANNAGVRFNAGFLINPEFVTLYEICYSTTMASPIYTRHELNGKAIKYAVKESRRIGFKVFGVPKQAKPDNNYKTEAQIKRFNKQFGNYQTYISKKSFLSRGHLTPDADFIFPSGQFATYFYTNVCPQFQDINGGNWVRVEQLARKIAGNRDEKLDVYTGVYDVLQLIDDKGDHRRLYLADGDLIPVPKWTWKVLMSPKTNSAIVFITLNNPYAEQSDIQEFCPNVCTQSGYVNRHFSNLKKGYTFCCSLNDFKKIVNVLPPTLSATELLTMP